MDYAASFYDSNCSLKQKNKIKDIVRDIMLSPGLTADTSVDTFKAADLR